MLIFIDLETTGMELEDKICSVGILLFDDKEFVSKYYTLLNEGKKIPALASMQHNITNEMIAKSEPFKKSDLYKILESYNSFDNTLVVHNQFFVVNMLERSGLKWNGKIIDTQRVVKHLVPDLESFALEFLRYELKLYRSEEELKRLCGIKDALIAHHALSDACVIKLLFDYLENEKEREVMYNLSFESVLLAKFSFGKYAGRYIEEITMSDPGYIEWMLSLENLDDDLRYSLEYYLKG